MIRDLAFTGERYLPSVGDGGIRLVIGSMYLGCTAVSWLRSD